jgi:protein-tyrosine phosphatase
MDYSKLSLRIPLEGTFNTRDLGGYPTQDGFEVRYGRMIRTDEISHITEKDKTYLSAVLHVHDVVDLRSQHEQVKHTDQEIPGAVFVSCPLSDDHHNGREPAPHEPFTIPKESISHLVDYIYRLSPIGDITEAMETSYREFVKEPVAIEHLRLFFRLLLANKTGSVLFHCADGKDRTGVAAALFLSALHVSREAIFYDYLKTNDYVQERIAERERYLREECHVTNETVIHSLLYIAGTHPKWLGAAFEEIDTSFGGVEAYLRNQLLLTEEDREELRRGYLEKSQTGEER